jgi:hypothetical protein
MTSNNGVFAAVARYGILRRGSGRGTPGRSPRILSMTNGAVMRFTVILSLTLLAAAPPIQAQRLANATTPPPPPFGAHAPRNPLAPIFADEVPDHRWEGFAIGALILGGVGAVAGSQLCHLSDSVNQHCVGTAVGLGFLGALAGGITGGLIGGAIPKVPSDTTH